MLPSVPCHLQNSSQKSCVLHPNAPLLRPQAYLKGPWTSPRPSPEQWLMGARYHNTASGPSPPGHLLASQAPPSGSLWGSSEHPTKSQSGDLHLGPEGPCLPTGGGQSGWAYQAGRQCGESAPSLRELREWGQSASQLPDTSAHFALSPHQAKKWC